MVEIFKNSPQAYPEARDTLIPVSRNVVRMIEKEIKKEKEEEKKENKR